MRDLEIRGAGNLLGPQQSGHIAAVGYDLYCKLLGEAVEVARGRSQEERYEPAFLAIDVPGAVPDDYVGDVREKFRIFRRVAAASTREDFEDLREELTDRFGKPPKQVRRLLLCQRTRIEAGAVGIERIAAAPADQPGVVLHGPEPSLAKLRRDGFKLRSIQPGQAFLPVPQAKTEEEALQFLVRVLRAT